MQNLAEKVDEPTLVREALANFAALIDDVDFSGELELMGIGRLQFLRRKQMIMELRGLYMALWRLALARSFPRDADAMFSVFLRQYGDSHKGKIPAQTVERAREYWGMIQPHGDADFIDVGRHLTSFCVKEQTDTRALTLKLALDIRKAYRFIFERLI